MIFIAIIKIQYIHLRARKIQCVHFEENLEYVGKFSTLFQVV